MGALYGRRDRARFDRADNAVARNLIRDNHVYVACQTDDDLPYVLKYSGEDNIVIGSDYGHNDTSSRDRSAADAQKQGRSRTADHRQDSLRQRQGALWDISGFGFIVDA